MSAASIRSGGAIDTLDITQYKKVSTMLSGPVSSTDGNALSLSGTLANFLSYEDGNWASAM